MAEKNKRFIRTLQESSWAGMTEIWVDRETGVNYLYHVGGGSGLTPLLNRDGTPVVTTVFYEDEE